MNHIYFKRDRDKPISFLNRQILINQISRNAVKINIVHLRQNPDYFIPQLTIWLRHPVYFTEIFWSVVRWQHRVRNMIFQDFRILIIKQNILSCSLLKVLKWRQTSVVQNESFKICIIHIFTIWITKLESLRKYLTITP